MWMKLVSSSVREGCDEYGVISAWHWKNRTSPFCLDLQTTSHAMEQKKIRHQSIKKKNHRVQWAEMSITHITPSSEGLNTWTIVYPVLLSKMHFPRSRTSRLRHHLYSPDVKAKELYTIKSANVHILKIQKAQYRKRVENFKAMILPVTFYPEVYAYVGVIHHV